MAVLSGSAFSDVDRWVFTRDQQRGAENIVGEVISSASGAIENVATERLLSALKPYLTTGTVTESVTTTALVAR